MGASAMGGNGLFSQGNMQQKSAFGNTQNGLFAPKTVPANNNIFGTNPAQASMFGGAQANSLNQGGIFSKGPTNPATGNNMGFNNTAGTSSKARAKG